MGADSSTLNHLESLNSTLSELEKKMFFMEDYVLHHERTIAQDNVVLIAEKMIQTRVGVNLVVGPLLGTIGSDFVRILVEVDKDTIVTFNVFEKTLDDKLMFVYAVSLSASKGVPIARTLTSLRSNAHYCIYLGGIDASQTISTFASFYTLSKSFERPRFLFLHNTRVDKAVSQDFSLWKEVHDTVPTLPERKPTSDINKLPVNFIVHLGNLVSVESIFKDKSLGLLDLLLREDVDAVRVLEDFNDMENSIRQLYRNAFNNKILKELGRRCGWFFLAGDGEAAHSFSSYFAVQIEQIDDKSDSATNDVEVANKNAVVKEMKYLLLGVLVRMARKICWSYMRQLWDDNYDELKQYDDEREYYFRSILMQRKLIIAKTHMRSILNGTVIKSVKEFGTEYKASYKLTERLVVIDNEIIELNANLRIFAMKSSELNAKLEVTPNGVSVVLGNICVLVIEAAWGNLAPDGQMLADNSNSVEINQKIFDSLEEKLSMENIFATVCLSSCPLTPTENQLETKAFLNESLAYRMLDRNEAPVYRFAPVDVKRLLKSFVTWQQTTQNHTVLLIEPHSKFSAKGFVNSLNLDGSQSARTSLQQIKVGKMISADFIQWYNFDTSLLDNVDATVENKVNLYSPYLSVVDRLSRTTQRSFWDVVLVPAEKPSQSESSVTGWVAGQTALSNVRCVSARVEEYHIVLGPVVGLVSATTAVIFLELQESCQLELLCIDHMSGEEHLCVRMAAGNRPTYFYFQTLKPNHSYDIMLPCYGRKRLGTFTTHHNGTLTNEKPDVCRLQIVGAIVPIHQNHLSSLDKSSSLLDPRAQQLTRLALDTEVCNTLSGMLAVAWNGIDVTIHCGSHIDWSSSLDAAISILIEAENQILSLSSSEHSTALFIHKTKECLRKCYSLYWGNKISKLLSRGSHKVFSSPVFDLLSSFQADSLSTTTKEMTPFVMEHLTSIFTALHHEYQEVPWSNEVIHQHSKLSYIHQLAGDRVVLFELQPSLVQFFRASTNQNLIRTEQLYQLSVLLSNFGKDSFHESASTLVILSPLPLLIDDDHEFSAATIRYTRSEVISLLDTVCAWKEGNLHARNVVIVSSGTSRGFTGNVEVRAMSAVIAANAATNNNTDEHSVGTVSVKEKSSKHSASSKEKSGTSKTEKSTTPKSIPVGHIIYQHCCGSSTSQEGAVSSSNTKYSSAHRQYNHVITFHPTNPTNTILEIPISSAGPTGASIHFVDNVSKRVAGVTESPVMNSPRLHDTAILSEVTNKLKGIIRPMLLSTAPDELGSDPIIHEIHRTIHFIGSQEAPLIEQCHAVFQSKRAFYFPLHGYCDVEECMSQVFCWFVERISQSEFQKICCQPSGFAVRFVWDYLLLLECERKNITKHVDCIQMTADHLVADKEFFGKFLFVCFEVQLVMEYFYSSEYLNKV